MPQFVCNLIQQATLTVSLFPPIARIFFFTVKFDQNFTIKLYHIYTVQFWQP